MRFPRKVGRYLSRVLSKENFARDEPGMADGVATRKKTGNKDEDKEIPPLRVREGPINVTETAPVAAAATPIPNPPSLTTRKQ